MRSSSTPPAVVTTTSPGPKGTSRGSKGRALMRSSSTPPAVVTTTSPGPKGAPRARLDEVLLHAAGGGHDHVHHAVLHQEAHVLAHAGRGQVGREAEEDLGARGAPRGRRQARVGRPGRLVAQAPGYLARARGQARARAAGAAARGRHEPLSRAQVDGVRCCTKTQPATRCSAGPLCLARVLVRRQCWLVVPEEAIMKHGLPQLWPAVGRVGKKRRRGSLRRFRADAAERLTYRGCSGVSGRPAPSGLFRQRPAPARLPGSLCAAWRP